MFFDRLKPTALALSAGLLAMGAVGAAYAEASNAPDTMPAVPRFFHMAPHHPEMAQAAGGLPTWAFAWTYNGHNYNAKFAGTAPTAAASTTPSFIIPLKIVIGTTSFSMSTMQPNGQTALADTVASPVFKPIRFREGGAKLGRDQYIDAYARESFWPTVLTNPTWHAKLGAPTVLPEVTITVPKGFGSVGTEFGVKVALVDINYIDGKLNSILAANPQITPGTVPVFVAYDTYETSGGCCIGGYHNATGAQTYMLFDYVEVVSPGAFSQDVSALSHEMGEWYFDPLVNNTNTPCGIYEVGDPLERESNYGGYKYMANGMTYNLQDMVQPPYFGAPLSTSLAGRFTFQGTKVTVCQNGS